MAKVWIITRKYLWLNLFRIFLSSVYLGIILNFFYTLLVAYTWELFLISSCCVSRNWMSQTSTTKQDLIKHSGLH